MPVWDLGASCQSLIAYLNQPNESLCECRWWPWAHWTLLLSHLSVSAVAYAVFDYACTYFIFITQISPVAIAFLFWSHTPAYLSKSQLTPSLSRALFNLASHFIYLIFFTLLLTPVLVTCVIPLDLLFFLFSFSCFIVIIFICCSISFHLPLNVRN